MIVELIHRRIYASISQNEAWNSTDIFYIISQNKSGVPFINID